MEREKGNGAGVRTTVCRKRKLSDVGVIDKRTIAFFNCFFAALATALSDVCLPQTSAITSTRNTNNRAYIVAQF